MALSNCPLWQAAYESLNGWERDALPLDQDATPWSLLDLTTTRIEEVKSERLRWKLPNGEVFIPHDALGKVAKWLKKFVEAGDLLVQVDPVHTAPPWAAVRFVLQVSVNNLNKHAAILEGVEKITYLLVWGKFQEQLMPHTTHELAKEMRQSFVRLYASILAFLAKACQFLRQKSTKHAVKGIFSSSEKYNDCMKAIDNHKERVHEISQQLIHESSLQQSDDLQRLKQILFDLERPIQRVESSNKQIARRLDDIEQEKILSWASEIPYAKHLAVAEGKALKGTGQWLFTHPDFLRWNDSSSSQILWMHGIPGSGKSTLLSMLARRLIEDYKQHGSAYPLYFFCERNEAEPERSDPEQILRCLLRQASSLPGEAALHSNLRQRYEERRTSGDLSIDEASELLLSTIQASSVTYILIDALDECRRDIRYQLLQKLAGVLNESSNLVKIFVSSRDDQDISCSLAEYPSINIEASNNREDIDLYVSHELERLIKERRLLPTQRVSEDLKHRIKQRLCNGAQGMFKWVELQLQYLCTLHLPGLVEKRLGHLPRRLEEIYEELYDRQMNGYEPEERQLTEHIFGWLRLSQENLGFAKLAALLCVSADSASEITKETVLDLSFNLVVHDAEQDIFRFAHLSVRDFLEEKCKDDLRFDHDMATSTCLRVLEQKGHQYEDALPYAVWYWAAHAALANGCQDFKIRAQLEAFLNPDSPTFCWWSRHTSAEIEKLAVPQSRALLARIKETVSDPPHPLFATCEWGLLDEAHRIITSLDPHAIDSILNITGSTALSIASYHGFSEIVKKLIEHGAYVDANIVGIKSGVRGTALQVASDEGHPETVRVLLDNGADVNAPGSVYDSALTAASEEGHLQVVEDLLCEGADVNAQGDFSVHALVAASLKGHLQIVLKLLDRGADVNAQSRRARNALNAVSQSGNLQINEGLLYQGADVNASAPSKATPLVAACLQGHHEIASKLLGHGADINAQSRFGSALTAALSRGHLQVVKELLYNGADINAQSEIGTALDIASRRGSDRMMQILLDGGADPNQKGIGGETALHVASRALSDGVVRILLEKGADPDIPNYLGWRPLHYATRFRESIVQILLEKGADPNPPDFDGVSALHVASKKGYGRTVQMLLQSGANPNQSDINGRRALYYASRGGFESIVQMLLEKQADVDSRLHISSWSPNCSALRIALENGHNKTSQLLVDAGAYDVVTPEKPLKSSP